MPVIERSGIYVNAPNQRFSAASGSLASSLLDPGPLWLCTSQGVTLRGRSLKMNVTEFRVRPVTRFVVTKYESDDEARTASSSVIGEFLTIDSAETVAKAMQVATPMSVFVEPDRSGQIGGARPDAFPLRG